MKRFFAIQTVHGTLATMAVILCLMLIVAACQPSSNSAGSNDAGNSNNEANLDDESRHAEVWTEKGYLVAKEDNRWLITVYEAGAGEELHKQAGWFTVNEHTAVTSEQGQAIEAESVEVGSRVKLWTAGAIAESYPVQGTAAEVMTLGTSDNQVDEQAAEQTRIAESYAVRQALEYVQSEEFIGPWYVVKTVFDEAEYQWLVQVASEMELEQVETVVLDAANGTVIEKPVAENNAFRVYEPQENEEVDGTFTVRGEARVFEGAFSWRLEDGHFVLKEGHATTDAGAPEWGSFQFDVEFEQTTNPIVTLVLYEASAKDGSPQHELIIPLQADSSLQGRLDENMIE